MAKAALLSPARMPQTLHPFLPLPKFTNIWTELQAFSWGELPADTGTWWEQQLTRGYHVHTITHNRSYGTQPAPRLRAFLLEKATEDLKNPKTGVVYNPVAIRNLIHLPTTKQCFPATLHKARTWKIHINFFTEFDVLVPKEIQYFPDNFQRKGLKKILS